MRQSLLHVLKDNGPYTRCGKHHYGGPVGTSVTAPHACHDTTANYYYENHEPLYKLCNKCWDPLFLLSLSDV